MAPPTEEELAAVEVRLNAILASYEGTLEAATIYGIPTLRRPGARAHDWFAFVKPASKHVAFHFMPVLTQPGLRESLSPALAKRLTGKAVFTFARVDEALFAELETVVRPAPGPYRRASRG